MCEVLGFRYVHFLCYISKFQRVHARRLCISPRRAQWAFLYFACALICGFVILFIYLYLYFRYLYFLSEWPDSCPHYCFPHLVLGFGRLCDFPIVSLRRDLLDFIYHAHFPPDRTFSNSISGFLGDIVRGQCTLGVQ